MPGMTIWRNRWWVAMASVVFFFALSLLVLAIFADHPERISSHLPLYFGFGLAGSLLGPVYFLPTIIALHRPNALAIFLLNFFLGWSFLGWLGALVWSVVKPVPPSLPA